MAEVITPFNKKLVGVPVTLRPPLSTAIHIFDFDALTEVSNALNGTIMIKGEETFLTSEHFYHNLTIGSWLIVETGPSGHQRYTVLSHADYLRLYTEVGDDYWMDTNPFQPWFGGLARSADVLPERLAPNKIAKT